MAHQTVADAVADQLRNAITEGVLADGRMLRQDELARQFGSSRVPVREALLKLEAEGLVVVHPRKGVMVTSLRWNDFQEILEMRCALETLALQIAIPNLTSPSLTIARQALQEADACVERPPAGEASAEFEARWGRMNWTFHRSLYVAASRPRLLEAIENLHLLFARHLRARRHIVLPSPGSSGYSDEWPKARAEHYDILSFCERGDAQSAIRALRAHIEVHGQEVVRRLQEMEPAETK